MEDIEPDSHCAKGFVWGKSFGVKPLVATCDMGVVRKFPLKYGADGIPRANRVLVNVCLWRNKRVSYCSGWK